MPWGANTTEHDVPPLNPPVEERKLERELRLLERARAEGVANRPHTDDGEPDAIQREIVDRCAKGVDDIRQIATKRLRGCAERLGALAFAAADRDFETPLAAATHDIAKLRLAGRDELIELRLEERRQWREREAFKRANGLSRSAQYPSARLLALASLALIVFGEALANAYLFARGTEFGLLGGWLQALTIAATNASLSFVAGLLVFRNLLHVSQLRRTVAVFFLLTFLSAVGFMHLTVAHYRVLLEVDPLNALAQAVPHLRADPLSIDNLEALLLIAVGVVATVAATLDGFCLADDRYPGYGRQDRRYVAAYRAYEGRKARLRRDIERIAAAAVTVIRERIEMAEDKATKASRMLNEAGLLLQRYEQSAELVARTCHRLLAKYREENRRVRTTLAPAYFGRYPELARELGDRPERLSQQRGRILAERDEIVAGANRALSQLRELVERELEGLFAYTDGVERTAERRLAEEAKLLRRQGEPSQEAWA